MSIDYVSGNIAIRQMVFTEKGKVVDGHAHNFDHTTYIAKGIIQVELLDDGGSVVRTVVKDASKGFNWILIQAHKIHRLTCLSDGGALGHCIFPHRSYDGQIVEEYDGWEEAYE